MQSLADLVIEAIFEDQDLKKRLFAELEHICDHQTILASNTSSISIITLEGATKRP